MSRGDHLLFDLINNDTYSMFQNRLVKMEDGDWSKPKSKFIEEKNGCMIS